MKLLAIDSSGLVASAAIATEDCLLAEYTVNYKKTHSQTLLPMVDAIVSMLELDLKEIDAIAITAGPGSFTGLRIGAATAKGLGQALNKPLISVPTVDALAYNLYGTDKVICPLMDARRNQTYTGLYEFIKEEESCRLSVIKEQCAVDIGEIISEINSMGREVIFLGDGVPVFRKQLSEEINVPFTFAPGSCNRQRASAVGMLAAVKWEKGEIEEARDHAPEYLRLSQAERERKEGKKSADKN